MGNKAIKGKIGSDTCYFVPYFPVGSIYISVTNTNPSTIFGGTWERIQGKFLIGADDSTYKLGATGGSSSHTHTNSSTGSTTLTANQIPSHTHSVGAHSHGLNSHTHTYAKSNSTTESHTLTVSEMPSHTHSHRVVKQYWSDLYNRDALGELPSAVNAQGYNQGWSSYTGGANCANQSTGGGKGHTHSISTTSTNTGAASGSTANSSAFNTGATGGGTGHTHTMSATGSSSNIPPYLSVYIWKRTA